MRSSLNALRHGLTARVVVLASEDMAAYQAFAKEIVDSLGAQTPVARQFAQTVADNQWRINRIRSIEDGMLAESHFENAGAFDAEHADIHFALAASRAFQAHSKDFVNLSLYEQRLHRSMREALRQLKDLKTARPERRTAQRDDAGPPLQDRENERLASRCRTSWVRLCNRANPPGRMAALAGARGAMRRSIHART